MTAPNPPERVLEAQLADVMARLDALERGSRSTQLGNSSLDGTSLAVVGPDGTRLASWGVAPDGTATTIHTDPKVPPRPNTPIVTSAIGGIEVEWNGQLIQTTPGNFSHVSIHVSPVEGFAFSDGNKVGALYQAGRFVVETDYVTQYVKLIAWSTSGVSSDPSFEQHASPGKVVADGVLDGIIDDLALADAAVGSAKIAAGAVTSTKIDDNAVTSPKIVAKAIQAGKIDTAAVQTEHLTADAVTSEKIAALAVTADELAANSVDAGKITAGAVKASHLESTLVLGNRLIAGTPTGTRVEMSASGLLVVRADGDTTFSVDSSTGDVTSMGEYYTSRFGERLAMNSGGLQSPTIRAYPNRGSRYADLRSYTRTVNGTDLANWEFRVPLAPGTFPYDAGLVDFCVYDANFAPYESSRLRYRPFDNGSGIVHPAWASDGQNVAIAFFAGRAWITNSANSARVGLTAGDLASQGGITAATGISAGGTVSGANLSTNGRMDAANHCTVGLGLKVGDTVNAVGGQITTREMTAVGNIAVDGNIYLKGTVQPSDARLKYRFAPLESSALEAFREVEWPSWLWLPSPTTNPDAPDGVNAIDPRRHVMATAQDMQAHPLLAMVVTEGTPGVSGREEDDTLGFDIASLVGIQGAALREAGDRITALEDELAALRARIGDAA